MSSETTKENAGDSGLLDDVVETLTTESESLEGRLTAVETAVNSADITISDVAAHYAKTLESSLGVITPDDRDELESLVEELADRGHDVSWENIKEDARFVDEKDDVYDAAYDIRHTDGLSDAEKQERIQELITTAQDEGVDATVNGVVQYIKEQREAEVDDDNDADNTEDESEADTEDEEESEADEPDEQDTGDSSSDDDPDEVDEEPIAPPAPDGEGEADSESDSESDTENSTTSPDEESVPSENSESDEATDQDDTEGDHDNDSEEEVDESVESEDDSASESDDSGAEEQPSEEEEPDEDEDRDAEDVDDEDPEEAPAPEDGHEEEETGSEQDSTTEGDSDPADLEESSDDSGVEEQPEEPEPEPEQESEPSPSEDESTEVSDTTDEGESESASDGEDDSEGDTNESEPPVEDVFAGGKWTAPSESENEGAEESSEPTHSNDSSSTPRQQAETADRPAPPEDEPPADDPFADVSVDQPDSGRASEGPEQSAPSPSDPPQEPPSVEQEPSPETPPETEAPPQEPPQTDPPQSEDVSPPSDATDASAGPSVEGMEDLGESLAEETASAGTEDDDEIEDDEGIHPANTDSGFEGEDAADIDDEDLVRSAAGEEHLEEGRLPQETDPTTAGLMNLPNYAQDIIDFEFVFDEDDEYLPEGVEGQGLVVTELEDDEEYVAIAHVEPRSWSIHTAEKKNQIIQTYQSSFLATLDFPIQIVSYPKKFEITDHINRLEEVLEEGRTRGGDSLLVNMGRALYPNWIESYIIENDMKQREFYLVIPIKASQIQQFEGDNSGLMAQMEDMPGLGAIAGLFTEDDGEDVTRYQCLRELKSRLDRVASGLGRLDVDVTPINDRDETLSVLYHYYNDKQPRKQAFPTGPFTVHDTDMPVGTDGLEVDDLTEVNYEPERSQTAPDMGGDSDE